MRLDQSTFIYVFFIVFAAIIISHLYLKNVLSEPIFRFEMPKFGWFSKEEDKENDESIDEQINKVYRRKAKHPINRG